MSKEQSFTDKDGDTYTLIVEDDGMITIQSPYETVFFWREDAAKMIAMIAHAARLNVTMDETCL